VTGLLQITDLTVKYGQITAIENISVSVAAGESIALIGANGSGKSTLIKSIIGLVKPAAGSIAYQTEDLLTKGAHRRSHAGIGYSPEGRRVFPGLSVRENLEVASFSGRKSTSETVERMYSMFPALKLKDAMLGWTLSGGQQQMLAISRALMSHPRLLLLDEPSLGLSPLLTDEVLSQIPVIAGNGTAIVLAEQNLSKALDVTDRAYVFQTGRVVLEGPSKALRSDQSIRDKFLGGL